MFYPLYNDLIKPYFYFFYFLFVFSTQWATISEFQKLSIKTRLSAKSYLAEREFSLQDNKKPFSYRWPRTILRFETNACGNSEMACYEKKSEIIQNLDGFRSLVAFVIL